MAHIKQTEWQEAMLPPDLELWKDVEYGRGGEGALTMHIVRPRSLPQTHMPVVMAIHGGGWAGGSKDSCLSALLHFARRDYLCVSVGHRFSGDAPFPAMIEDCKCAVRFLRANAFSLHLDPKRIGVWGVSSGGHLAALLGTSAHVPQLEGTGGWAEQSSRVQAVCDWFGPTSFPLLSPDENWPLFGGRLGDHWENVVLADPITHITPDAPPFLILHGDKDDLVPLQASTRLYEALKAKGVEAELQVIEGAGHGFDSPDVDARMTHFFERHLHPGD